MSSQQNTASPHASRPGRPKSNALTPRPSVARLVAHREKQGWTQPQTAERLGISVCTLCGNRTPNGPNTLKILELLTHTAE